MSFIFASIFLLFFKSMGLSGLEPPTSRLSGVRSNQLSHWALFIIFLVDLQGLEPGTDRL